MTQVNRIYRRSFPREVDLQLLLDLTLSSLTPLLHTASCRLIRSQTGKLGSVITHPRGLQIVITRLIRIILGAISNPCSSQRIHFFAERFLDEDSRQDWVELGIEFSANEPLSGLELRNMAGLVRQLCGFMDCESHEGHTTFRLYIPCEYEAVSAGKDS